MLTSGLTYRQRTYLLMMLMLVSNFFLIVYCVYNVFVAQTLRKSLWRIQMKEVVRIAIMVPIGMDLWASLRSPDLLEPAIIPEIKHTQHHS